MTAVLALDFSTRTGIAFGRPGDVPILAREEFARWDGATEGEVASAVMRWIPGALAVYKPDLVVIEGALPHWVLKSKAAARIAIGGAFVIHGQCNIAGVRCIEVRPDDWHADIFSTARVKREDAKKKAKQIAEAFGVQPKSDDEADAFCLWLYSMKKFAGFYTPRMQQVLAKAQMRLVA